MTILELTDQKEVLKSELSEMIKLGETENRKLNELEEHLFEEKRNKITEIETQISDKEKELKQLNNK
jgi:hypothetical protein